MACHAYIVPFEDPPESLRCEKRVVLTKQRSAEYQIEKDREDIELTFLSAVLPTCLQTLMHCGASQLIKAVGVRVRVIEMCKGDKHNVKPGIITLGGVACDGQRSNV